MKKKKIIKNLSALKINAMKLRAKHQIPFYLAYLINQLDEDSSREKVVYLMFQTENMMRVQGFYQKYPLIEDEYDKKLRKDIRRFK